MFGGGVCWSLPFAYRKKVRTPELHNSGNFLIQSYDLKTTYTTKVINTILLISSSFSYCVYHIYTLSLSYNCNGAVILY